MPTDLEDDLPPRPSWADGLPRCPHGSVINHGMPCIACAVVAARAEGEKAATERIVAALHASADEFDRIGKAHGRPNMGEWATTLRVEANAIADGTHPGLRSSTEGELR